MTVIFDILYDNYVLFISNKIKINYNTKIWILILNFIHFIKSDFHLYLNKYKINTDFDIDFNNDINNVK